jgi:UDP-N-acetylglucosamine--N-acetylmuramyl-(pentapeptide) pyrophosphoryl-undecaprenol N-acetylglucosamine transferase
MVKNKDVYPIIYISGGGLGSHLINETVKDSLKLLLQKYQVILQTGDNKVFNDYKTLIRYKEHLDKNLKSRFLPVSFIQAKDLGYLLHNIDAYVGRAGANTVYEMGVLQIPSIFIPIPWVTHNEQYRNAEVLVNLGLAEIIQEGELTSSYLLLRLEKFLQKDKKINKKELEKVFRTDAIKTILKEIEL